MRGMRGGLAWAPFERSPAVPAASPAAAPFHPVVRWAFYLFVASLPFEWPKRSIPMEITTLTGAVFLLATLLQPSRCYARRPTALWWFAASLYVYWMSWIATGLTYPADVLKQFPLRLELVLVFWAVFNLMLDERMATRAALIFGLACGALAGITLAGAVNLDEEWVKKSGRVTLFGQNANHAGLMLASGALALVGLTYGRDRKLIRPRILVWPILGAIGMAILKTGSRGSLLALTLGLWTYAVCGQSLKMKIRNTVVALVALVLLAWAAWQLPLMRKRFQQAEGGDLAGRERIFPAAWVLFLERPLMGWGPAQNHYELARRLYSVEFRPWRDTHNLVLEVLTAGGLMGAVVFFPGVGLCVWGAWKARHGIQGILPFAMAVALLMGNMSGNYIALKLFWLVLAWGPAAAASLAGPPRAPPTRASVGGGTGRPRSAALLT